MAGREGTLVVGRVETEGGEVLGGGVATNVLRVVLLGELLGVEARTELEVLGRLEVRVVQVLVLRGRREKVGVAAGEVCLGKEVR